MFKLFAATLTLALALAPAQVATAPAAPADLAGKWKVDLRPSPDAAPYFQELTVQSASEGELRGVFYGTAIEHGRVNDDWGSVCFAFVTRDGSGEYHTSGELTGGKLRGTTLSIGRGFLAVWSAERVME